MGAEGVDEWVEREVEERKRGEIGGKRKNREKCLSGKIESVKQIMKSE